MFHMGLPAWLVVLFIFLFVYAVPTFCRRQHGFRHRSLRRRMNLEVEPVGTLGVNDDPPIEDQPNLLAQPQPLVPEVESYVKDASVSHSVRMLLFQAGFIKLLADLVKLTPLLQDGPKGDETSSPPQEIYAMQEVLNVLWPYTKKVTITDASSIQKEAGDETDDESQNDPANVKKKESRLAMYNRWEENTVQPLLKKAEKLEINIVVGSDAKRPNLIIKFKGEDESDACVSFIGSHFDVAKFTASEWETDKRPNEFSLTEDEMFGRGVTDSLGHVALLTIMLQQLAERKETLQRSLYVVFVSAAESEEEGIGMDVLLKANLLAPLSKGPVYWMDAANLQPYLGAGGIQNWELVVEAINLDSNAITIANEILDLLQETFYEKYGPSGAENKKETDYGIKVGSSFKPLTYHCSSSSDTNPGVNWVDLDDRKIPGRVTITGDFELHGKETSAKVGGSEELERKRSSWPVEFVAKLKKDDFARKVPAKAKVSPSHIKSFIENNNDVKVKLEILSQSSKTWVLELDGVGGDSGNPNQCVNAIEIANEALWELITGEYQFTPLTYHSGSKKVDGSAETTLDVLPSRVRVTGDIRTTPFYIMDEVKKVLEDKLDDLTKSAHFGASHVLTWNSPTRAGVYVDTEGESYKVYAKVLGGVLGCSNKVIPWFLPGTVPMHTHPMVNILLHSQSNEKYDIAMMGFGTLLKYHKENETASLRQFLLGLQVVEGIIDTLNGDATDTDTPKTV